ncbi:FMN-dependent NADH-azoreductase [Kurthia sibirica]|uniref:FMN dependent NADH:quinone oxidoreductase n=1 Tax=Kurthia sibirica TaxID=202750 RepID=A0A2U3AKA2_9BACL|nr:FMN-dependent NADH-azoreductase [Kurthia sibirica]PWI24931.1 FMN-dependent NADH-azoreductase [Kurthia sibirica]GEK33158.1 FMN-dependent NADH-azoreductase 3 [Kurthia sibirica]
MTKVLVVKANNRPSTEGVSSKMYEVFMEAAKNVANLEVTTYDVYEENTPYFGQEVFNAYGKLAQGQELNEAEAAVMAAQTKARQAITDADVVVYAFPLWNLTIPAKLQTFFDYTYAAGFSFKYDTNGNLVSLLTDKKAIVLNARGGIYSTPETAGMEMAVNYVKTVVGGVFGMEIIDEVIIEGHNAMPAKADEIKEAGYEAVKAVVAKLANLTVNA